MRDFLLFLHIVGAAGWIGGGMALVWSTSKMVKSDAVGAGSAVSTVLSGGDRYFGPVTALVLLSGIGLVLTEEAYGWSDTFVIMGLAAFLLSAIWNTTVGRKADQSFQTALVTEGADRVGALRTWQRGIAFDYVLLAIVLWAMIVKLGAG